MTIYKLVFAVLISAGFTVPSWGMEMEDDLSQYEKDHSVAVSTVLPMVVCSYVSEEDQKIFLEIDKRHRKYFQGTTFYLKISERIPSDQLQGLLEGFTCLNKLDLSGCKQITDDGMQYISQLRNLTRLNLTDCPKFTGEGMQNIFQLENLTHLKLTLCPRLTNKGVKYISHLKNLTHLKLTLCPRLTNKGVEYISRLQKLQSLDLLNCKRITDEVHNIPQLQNLSWLMIGV